MSFKAVLFTEPIGEYGQSASIKAGQSVSSGNGRYHLGVELNGDVCVYTYNNPDDINAGRKFIRCYRTGSTIPSKHWILILQDDGNLVLKRNINDLAPFWTEFNEKTIPRVNGPFYLLLSNDGELAVYNNRVSFPVYLGTRTDVQYTKPISGPMIDINDVDEEPTEVFDSEKPKKGRSGEDVDDGNESSRNKKSYRNKWMRKKATNVPKDTGLFGIDNTMWLLFAALLAGLYVVSKNSKKSTEDK